MPRIDFTFEGEKLSGRGIAIVTTPRSVIMVSALSVKPNGLQEVRPVRGFVPDIRVSTPTKSTAVVRTAEMRRQALRHPENPKAALRRSRFYSVAA